MVKSKEGKSKEVKRKNGWGRKEGSKRKNEGKMKDVCWGRGVMRWGNRRGISILFEKACIPNCLTYTLSGFPQIWIFGFWALFKVILTNYWGIKTIIPVFFWVTLFLNILLIASWGVLKELSLANSNFLISISLQPDGITFNILLCDLTEFIV